MIYTDIKTVEDAFRATGRDINILPIVEHLPLEDQAHIINNYKLKVVVEAINQNEDGTRWEPDYTDNNWKYEPWWGIEASKYQPAGFGFSFSSYDCWDSYSTVGSRLCFRDRDRWRYATTQFRELYLEEILSLDRQRISREAKSQTAGQSQS